MWKRTRSYDFTHVGPKRKQQMNKQNKLIDSTVWSLLEGKGGWKKDDEDKEGQIYGDKRRPDSGWYAHNAMYRFVL